MVNETLVKLSVMQFLTLLVLNTLVLLNGNLFYYLIGSARVRSPSVGALAWNLEGYKAVGMTAMSGLNTKPSSLIKRYFGGKDLADIASWCESMLEHFPILAQAEFQSYQCSKFGVDVTSDCDQIEFFYPSGTVSLLNIVHVLFNSLTRKSEFSPIQLPNAKLLNDAESIALLAYYLAILHQPLHYTDLASPSSKKITTFYRTENSMEQSSLFDLWEETFINRMVRTSPHSWNDGWTHVAHLGELFAIEKRAFSKNKESSFNAWARQTASLGYQIYKTAESGMMNGTFSVDFQLDMTWNRILKNQILSAGSRIAIVMNEILKDRNQSLRAANELRSFENKIFKKVSFPDWSRNFLINFVILCVVVGTLCYVGKFYSRSKNFSSRNKYEHLTTEKEFEEKHS